MAAEIPTTSRNPTPLRSRGTPCSSECNASDIQPSLSQFAVSASCPSKTKNNPAYMRIRGSPLGSGENLTGNPPVENGCVRRSPRTAASSIAAHSKTKRPGAVADPLSKSVSGSKKTKSGASCSLKELEDVNGSTFFVGEPVPDEEARQRWPHHYVCQGSKRISWNSTDIFDDEDEVILNVKCHYLQANVAGFVFNLGDCAHVKGENGKTNYIGRILEFFRTSIGENYFTVQWFYRPEDTVMKDQAGCHDKKRVFYSDLRNDNLLDCIVSKVRVMQVSPSAELKSRSTPSYYLYYDMKYSVEYSTFQTMELGDSGEKSDFSFSACSGTNPINSMEMDPAFKPSYNNCESRKPELSLLDLFCGCGGMSTGLCLGANAADVKLVTKWAVDLDEAACQSLKLNHPKVQVRNEKVGDFLELLKEWSNLCNQYVNTAGKNGNVNKRISNSNKPTQKPSNVRSSKEYEVSQVVDICYGDPTNSGMRGLKFKVRWKGCGPSDDTWEPLEHLSNCKDRVEDFVREGWLSKLLPLPGDVDVICGGPPCQGISGYNRFRNYDAPLDDERNRQIVVFMDVVQLLKPKYVLMENVVDILKFAKASLGRYALSRLVEMNYQARLGIMAASCYGLPQFRLRAFLWGCHPNEKLPQFPLPTHEAILKGGPPVEFERNLVAFEEGQPRMLEKPLVLEDVLSDLPPVTNVEDREQMPYKEGPRTEFQRYIRSSKVDNLGSSTSNKPILYDHRPLRLGEDDYLRVSQIPKRKGANFRDLPGVIVSANNIAGLDPSMERKLLPSGRPLVPDYALSYWNGKSVRLLDIYSSILHYLCISLVGFSALNISVSRSFARLWWDEVVPTVLTVPDTHSQAVIHPVQDRVLTIRESARLQGFPDYYRLCGTVKERYRQLGNAVAIPVARALGYTLGLASMKQSGDGPLMMLPPKFAFPHTMQDPSSASSGIQE